MSDKNDIAIEVSNVSKQFILPHQKSSTLKSSFLQPFKKYDNEKQMALENISFSIKKGEFFGVVGRNGSGKSTLLKCLAGVYAPDKGHINVSGSLVPFIELGVGFNPELSGRDNVFLNGSLLGFSRSDIEAMYENIVEFAELEEFMDQKLKNYSSGMQVRLAFSIAIKAQGDILLLDEVLAVGDTNFQKKCFDYFRQLKDEKKTVILVSHNMDQISKFCTRVLLLNKGKIVHTGETEEVIDEYKLLSLSQQVSAKEASETSLDKKAVIENVEINGERDAVIEPREDISLSIKFKSLEDTGIIAAASIAKDDGTKVGFFNTGADIGDKPCEKNKTYTAQCTIPSTQFGKGTYRVDIAILDPDFEYLAKKPNAVRFSIKLKEKGKGGLINVDCGWDI